MIEIYKPPINRLFILVILAVSTLTTWGQDKLKPVTSKYAITNATIQVNPDKTIKKGTIVFEDGVILSVGSNISVPEDALVIDGDSMHIYAGFIAALSHLGIPEPKKGDKPSDDVSDYERSGITPEKSALDWVDMKDKSIVEYRKLGFTAAQVAPRQGMISGTTDLILLGKGSNQDQVVKSKNSLYSQLQGAKGSYPKGIYPNTVIGVMAKYRELFRKANQAREYKNRYASNSSGMQRYSTDLTIESLFPASSKQTPVTFRSPGVKDIMRVMALQRDLGFKVMLADVKQGWDAMDEIKSTGGKTILSLDFPKDPNAKKKEKEDAKEEENAEEKEEAKTAMDEEKERLEKRQAEERTKYYALSSTFLKNKITYGYSLVNLKSKDFKGAMKLVRENGLSDADALRALTTAPAAILGVSNQMGTLEKGKLANLVITDKPYFDEKSNVRYVFVDGKQFKYDAPKKDEKKKSDK